MTLRLSGQQSQLYEEGGWPETRLLEDLIETLDRQHITEEVVVMLDTGEVLFALLPNGGRPC